MTEFNFDFTAVPHGAVVFMRPKQWDIKALDEFLEAIERCKPQLAERGLFIAIIPNNIEIESMTDGQLKAIGLKRIDHD